MKKQYVLGGLVVLGAVALIAWYRKPKRNSEGFYGANGKMSYASKTKKISGGCAWCKDSEGNVYHTGEDRSCGAGDRCVSQYA